jgi:hypothetical protein
MAMDACPHPEDWQGVAQSDLLEVDMESRVIPLDEPHAGVVQQICVAMWDHQNHIAASDPRLAGKGRCGDGLWSHQQDGQGVAQSDLLEVDMEARVLAFDEADAGVVQHPVPPVVPPLTLQRVHGLGDTETPGVRGESLACTQEGNVQLPSDDLRPRVHGSVALWVTRCGTQDSCS